MKLILDSSAMIAFLRHESGSEVVKAALTEGEASAVAHAVNVMEVFYDFHRQFGEPVAQEAVNLLEAMEVRILEDFDADLWRDAARLKSKHRRISLADCVGIALTRRLDGLFVTADRHELEELERAGEASFLFVR